MFDGFELTRCEGEGVRLRVRYGGRGPAVLLLHGHPRTHATWHRVAPLLAAAGHTVVCPDLRGYGESDKPPTDERHSPYSKRAMAGDCLAVMRRLGHERFAVVGHDRGAYVATRLALDHPEAVSALSVLDAVPLGEALRRCDAAFAASWWHWFFLGQTDKPAERLINADPDAWYRATPEQMGAEAYEDYRRAIHDPATVHAMCEDYRAGLGVDREHDDADRHAGRRVTCRLQVLWATDDDMADLYGDVLSVWRDWAVDRPTGGPIASGHHIAEEAPEALVTALREFWRST
ncbi:MULTISPECIES: alpha/beta fold hydrolase [unclassified Streptomyces]|uniref:alpha/beta fold hydrolase n=1 Tax=unclassified Streptomyces TaxID=2593676 RepID=UPI000746D470|nr:MULTISPECIES: alpha/beta hydrolase [unclassified Streptomyces]KUL64334.1 alpha/beta hydrolase [Streptomyces sp. NRRL S-1521]THC54995.1 alpha/beta hydrolase [Streptomyces sp. A1499]